jgi:glutaredoxin
MDFIIPVPKGYTVYTKTDCQFCTKVKILLEDLELEYTAINCDKYLEADKAAFLEFIKQRAGKEHKTFPMIFHNGVFIGGFMDTKAYCDAKSD